MATGIAPASQGKLPVRVLLEQSQSRLQAVLPKHMSAEKVIQTCSNVVYSNPDLRECDPHSVVLAVLEGSELGLSFSRAAGEAYLVPFKENRKVDNKWVTTMKAQFIPGYRGLVRLMYQSNFVSVIRAKLVYEGEEFVHEYNGADLVFRHRPYPDTRGKRIIGVYAIAKLTNGESDIRYWTAGDFAFAEVPFKKEGYKTIYTVDFEKIDQACRLRLRSKAPNSPAWIEDWAEMTMKGPIRNLAKMLPKSDLLVRALEADERQYESALSVSNRTPSLERPELGGSVTGADLTRPRQIETVGDVISEAEDVIEAEGQVDGARERQPGEDE